MPASPTGQTEYERKREQRNERIEGGRKKGRKEWGCREIDITHNNSSSSSSKKLPRATATGDGFNHLESLL